MTAQQAFCRFLDPRDPHTPFFHQKQHCCATSLLKMMFRPLPDIHRVSSSKHPMWWVSFSIWTKERCEVTYEGHDCFHWATWPYFPEFLYENQWVTGQDSQLSDCRNIPKFKDLGGTILSLVQGVQEKLCVITVHCNPSLTYIKL